MAVTMASELKMEGLTLSANGEPRLSKSYTLNFMGDWGMANFHRICSWLTQQFCDRAGPESRTAIWSITGGGNEAIYKVQDGAIDLAIVTPVDLMKKALTGEAPFSKPAPNLRALGVLPQNDRMVLAVDPKYGIETFEELKVKKPALRIATSTNDGTNFIGYVADEFAKAHGINEAEIESWGAKYVRAQRPDECFDLVERGEADALLQEAIMTHWWSNLIESGKLVPLAADPQALQTLAQPTGLGLGLNTISAGYWKNLDHDILALDFSDFVVFVRDDMPKEVAYTLTWVLVETRALIEAQYKHMPPERSPLTYPLNPKKMAQAPFPLHDGAREYYARAGHI
jgi:uncharacterized protein